MLERLVQRQEAGAQAGGGGEDADFRMWDDQWQARPRHHFHRRPLLGGRSTVSAHQQPQEQQQRQ